MADRIVMGYWDCPYCGTKKILGTTKDCPNCGKPRGNETRFYMDKQHIEYVREDIAKNYGNGEDWLCSYCGGYNPNEATICTTCGHERDKEDFEYSDVVEKETKKEEENKSDYEKELEQNTFYHNEKSTPQENSIYETPSTNLKSLFGKIGINIARVFVVLLAIGLVAGTITGLVALGKALFGPKEFTCQDYWYTTYEDIEEYKRVQDSDWTVPQGAEDVTSRQEIRTYETVLDHYETVQKSRTVPNGGHYEYETRTRTVPNGGHYEYSYSNNGDGTFTEHSNYVTDYTTETYQESVWVTDYTTEFYTEQEPVYEQVPVYDTKYYYYIWKWVIVDTLTHSEHDKTPKFVEYEEIPNETRIGKTRIKYEVRGYIGNKKDKIKTYELDKEFFDKIEKNKQYTVTIMMNQIKEKTK